MGSFRKNIKSGFDYSIPAAIGRLLKGSVMLHIKEIPETTVAITGFQCDCCKSTYEQNDFVEMQEFLHWRNTGGFGSIFGDGTTIDIVLCQMCVQKLLGEYLQYPNSGQVD